MSIYIANGLLDTPKLTTLKQVILYDAAIAS